MKPVVVLGVSGSIAAYRAADLARDLLRSGLDVKICLTRSAREFVTPILFETLTGNPCLTYVFDEPKRGRMAHIDWAREASLILICPATANLLANLAHGNADDMLTTIVSATRAPIVIAPAMNPQMYASEANVENLSVLKARGVLLVEPQEGDVACGEHGEGKLAATSEIVRVVHEALFLSSLYKGKKIVITAGPTHEPIDPVRYIANRSSGKMGFALARAAIQLRAQVTLIAGPTALTPPPAAAIVRITTAGEMLDATLAACSGAHMLIGAAAVADFRTEKVALDKIRSDQPATLALVKNPDILAEAKKAYPDLAIVGFAAETTGHLEDAQKKLEAKGLVAIALNDVSRTDIGFDSEENEVTLLRNGTEPLRVGRDSKFNIARRILEAVAPFA
ncbi:MAG: bifunctional phosphopantothenoylcysteine decarboxylase/phosphopantothenate--cysteine ligase CoaBC [Armatimonadetes bacterium]|nr:bifunctional phosphopantothenoylcysteine decarboxylase/phosphopantothenate--cysteine ligase CoaBC [Armatimonadota bacterium]